MKIEIEFEEVERLKNQIATLKKENAGFELELKKFDKEEVDKRITELAQLMFENVIQRLFNEMGLNYAAIGHPFGIDFKKLEDQIGKSWWSSEKLEITIGQTVTNQFKNGILRFEIKRDER